MEKIVSLNILRVLKIGLFSAICVWFEVWVLRNSLLSWILATIMLTVFIFTTIISTVKAKQSWKNKRNKTSFVLGILLLISVFSYVAGSIQNYLVIKESERLYQRMKTDAQFSCIKGCKVTYSGYFIMVSGTGEDGGFVSADLFNFKRVYVTKDGVKFRPL